MIRRPPRSTRTDTLVPYTTLVRSAGLDDKKIINEEAIERAITVLKRFGERLADFHPNCVRAVATNTFRIARNIDDILPRAEAALGFPIEVIAGQEEARLIFSGITNELPPSTNRRDRKSTRLTSSH